jgi:hypothetical protein
MDFVPLINGYDRYQTPVHAERDSGGAVRWVAGEQQ